MASIFVKPFFFPYNPAGLELEKIKLECDRQHIDVSLLLLMRVERTVLFCNCKRRELSQNGNRIQIQSPKKGDRFVNTRLPSTNYEEIES